MNWLKSISSFFGQCLKQECWLPKTVSDFFQRRQQRAMLNALEVERLDRIRNPEKYRGK